MMKQKMKKTSMKKGWTGLAAGALALSLFAGTAIQPVPAEAAAVKLTAKKLSMKTGKTKTVKVVGAKTVKWTVTKGKALVKITANGKKVKIKALKAGTAVVTATVQSKKYNCTVKITGKAVSSGTSKKTKDDKTKDDKTKDDKTKDDKTKDDSSKEPEDPQEDQGGAGTSQEADASDASKDQIQASVLGASNFAFSMLQQLRKEDAKKENVLISPDSILTCLSMVAEGSAGNTRTEFEKAFGTAGEGGLDAFVNSLASMHSRLTDPEQEKYTSSRYAVADSIWTNETMAKLDENFVKRMTASFDAAFYNEAFSSSTPGKMNAWVDEKTKHMIPDIINSLDDEAAIVLLNAVYFESAWRDQYNDFQVDKEGVFTKKDGTKQTVNMLKDSDTGNYFLELEGGKGFIRYYDNPRFAFLGLLPPEGEDVDVYLGKLDGEKFLAAYRNRAERRIVTSIPEFQYDYQAELNHSMNELGIRDAFAASADFTPMATLKDPSRHLQISKVLHKTHIELDRNGTKAAAATAAVMVGAGSLFEEDPPKEEVINLDRPFVYGIIDTNTGMPLFLGTVDAVK